MIKKELQAILKILMIHVASKLRINTKLLIYNKVINKITIVLKVK